MSRSAHARLWYGIFVEQDELEGVYKALVRHQTPTGDEESTHFEMDPEDVYKDDVVDLLNHVIEHLGFKDQIKIWPFDPDEDGIALGVANLFYDAGDRYLGQLTHEGVTPDHPIFKLLTLMYDQVDPDCLQWCLGADYY